MIRITRNGDNLEIKNVVCFFVSNEVPAPYEEVKKTKEEDWSYQDYLTVACHKLKYNLIWLNKKFVQCIYKDDVISVDDPTTNVHISFNKDNVKDTIIFQGQANDEPGVNYEILLRAFEYMKFYMLNTFDEIRIASDKILSANLLASKGIPQPNYVLVNKKIMQDEDAKGNSTRESFWRLLDSLYPENENVNNEDGSRKYVVKILGGSLGIGVFICCHCEIEAILQAIFELDPGRELIIQQFKQNSGDIRAHAFSVDGKNYEIIACMKRNKIDNDFRSNVSLGATTNAIDLTDEQKEIILDTARLSGCRWVGVDLMDCEDGSNVVIEYNSSPGVQGISQQIKKNMFTLILEKIDKWFKENKDPEHPWADYANNTNIFVQYRPDIVEELMPIWTVLGKSRLKVMETCLSFIPGTQYKMHGKNTREEGLDCSGYVARVFKDAFDIDLPPMCVEYFTIKENNPWEKIEPSELQPGDIGVLNDTTKNNHCGIYAGNGKWFENSYVYGVQLTDFAGFKHFFRIKNMD